MKDLRHLRRYAAARHAAVPQEYDPGVPYWVHLMLGEMFAIAFNFGPRVRREVIAHDLGEDTGATYRDLRENGWTSEEARDVITRVTDPEGVMTRDERKKIALPLIAQGGFYPIATKLSDRGVNYLWGLLSGSVSMNAKYNREWPSFKQALFDRSDVRTLGAWYFVEGLTRLECKPIAKEDFETRPLKLLVNEWIAKKDKLFDADKVDLLPEWNKVMALLDAAYH